MLLALGKPSGQPHMENKNGEDGDGRKSICSCIVIRHLWFWSWGSWGDHEFMVRLVYFSLNLVLPLIIYVTLTCLPICVCVRINTSSIVAGNSKWPINVGPPHLNGFAWRDVTFLIWWLFHFLSQGGVPPKKKVGFCCAWNLPVIIFCSSFNTA